ncbi:MAG: glycosyltransferase [Bacteroidaceae bacterium]|nr:glycosyltransferase [Bacteroidaceae bacterium]
MKVTFIIPAYNVQPVVRRCLQSILPLLHDGHELILIDDGSTDKTAQIVHDFIATEQVPNALVLSQSNAGQSAARNKGIQMATGDYIWFIDADDYVDTSEAQQVIALANQAITSGKQIDAVVFGLKLEKRQTSIPNPILQDVEYDTGLNYFRQSNINGTFRTYPVNKLFRTALVRKLNLTFPCGRIYEDMQWNVQYVLQCERVLQLPLNPYHYVLHNTNSSTCPTRIQERDFQALTAVEEATIWFQKQDAQTKFVKEAFHVLVFTFLSSCLLRKYIPLSFSHPEAIEYVRQTMLHPLFRKAVRHCVQHPSIGLRRWGMALCIYCSPRLSRHIIYRMM